MLILLFAVMILVVLLIVRAHHTAPSLPPRSVGDPAQDRDRQRVMDDLRWQAAAAPRPAAVRRHRRNSIKAARR